jgi:hypothetical protein
MLPATLQFLITMIACAINERMQRKLDYKQEEGRVLKEILAALTGSRRVSFTAAQRRRLAIAGKALSPEERKKCCQVVKPGTILGWFRHRSAKKRTWKRFMKSHWDTLCACDFFSVEALGPFGTVRYMVFFGAPVTPAG